MRIAKLLSLAATSLLIAACAVTQEDLTASFVEAHPEATAEQASCTVGVLVDRYGIEGLEAELEAVEDSSEFTEAQFRAMVGCGMTQEVSAQLRTQMAELGVSDEARDCVVSELTKEITDADLDVLITGELTDAYYAKFFDALSACDALP